MSPTSALDIDAQLPSVRHHRAGRSMTAAEAVALIPDGSRVFIEPFNAVPLTLVAEMAAQHECLKFPSVRTTGSPMEEDPMRPSAPLVENPFADMENDLPWEVS